MKKILPLLFFLSSSISFSTKSTRTEQEWVVKAALILNSFNNLKQ